MSSTDSDRERLVSPLRVRHEGDEIYFKVKSEVFQEKRFFINRWFNFHTIWAQDVLRCFQLHAICAQNGPRRQNAHATSSRIGPRRRNAHAAWPQEAKMLMQHGPKKQKCSCKMAPRSKNAHATSPQGDPRRLNLCATWSPDGPG